MLTPPILTPLVTPPNERYNINGPVTLADGCSGTIPWTSKDWLGYKGTDCILYIDLEKETEINEIKIGWLNDVSSWIYEPNKEVEIYIGNDTNNLIAIRDSSLMYRNPTEDTTVTYTVPWHIPQTTLKDFPDGNIIENGYSFSSLKGKGRYIKLVIKNFGIIPEGKPGAGKRAWLFLDEIGVY